MAATSISDALVRAFVSNTSICIAFGFETISESVRQGCAAFAGQVFGKSGAHLHSKQSLKNEREHEGIARGAWFIERSVNKKKDCFWLFARVCSAFSMFICFFFSEEVLFQDGSDECGFGQGCIEEERARR